MSERYSRRLAERAAANGDHAEAAAWALINLADEVTSIRQMLEPLARPVTVVRHEQERP
jgi:hypothetical protein